MNERQRKKRFARDNARIVEWERSMEACMPPEAETGMHFHEAVKI